jgi:hypothetical protein
MPVLKEQPMREFAKCAVVVLMIAAPTSVSVAGSKSPKLAKCDGHHRRPANLYGSILPTVDPATGAATPANGGVDIFPSAPATLKAGPGQAPPTGKPVPTVPPIGALSPANTFRSC